MVGWVVDGDGPARGPEGVPLTIYLRGRDRDGCLVGEAVGGCSPGTGGAIL